MSFKICVIGCGGFAGYVHGPAQATYAAWDGDVELAGCCDLLEERAEEFAGRFGYRRFYTNAEEMLDREKPDAVFVLVMPHASAETAAVVLRRGIPLFLEKPPGMTVDELDGLIGLAERHRVPTQVGFNRRTMPLMRHARHILGGGFEPLMQVTYEMIRFDRSDPDFSFTAIHGVDAARFLAGSPYRWAQLRFEGDVEDPASRFNVTMEAECESGTAVHLHVQPMAGYVLESFAAHGVGESLVGQLFGPGSERQQGEITHWRHDKIQARITDEVGCLSTRLGIETEVVEFCRAVREGSSPGPALTQCRQQVRLMEAIRNRDTARIDFAASPAQLSNTDPHPILT